MSRFYGINPKPAILQAVQAFEDEVMVHKNNRFLISTVYLDMSGDRWAVAVAYNPSRDGGLLGHDNLLEVRYSYSPKNRGVVTMLRSDPMEEVPILTEPFTDPETFIHYALGHERNLLQSPV